MRPPRALRLWHVSGHMGADSGEPQVQCDMLGNPSAAQPFLLQLKASFLQPGCTASLGLVTRGRNCLNFLGPLDKDRQAHVASLHF